MVGGGGEGWESGPIRALNVSIMSQVHMESSRLVCHLSLSFLFVIATNINNTQNNLSFG